MDWGNSVFTCSPPPSGYPPTLPRRATGVLRQALVMGERVYHTTWRRRHDDGEKPRSYHAVRSDPNHSVGISWPTPCSIAFS